MLATLDVTAPLLPQDRPRYLMGVGKPIDIVESVARGIDMFDCVLPTRSGRHGQAWTDAGPLNITNARFAEDLIAARSDSIDCPASRDYSKAYLHHLFKAGELLGQVLLSWHNVAYYQIPDGAPARRDRRRAARRLPRDVQARSLALVHRTIVALRARRLRRRRRDDAGAAERSAVAAQERAPLLAVGDRAQRFALGAAGAGDAAHPGAERNQIFAPCLPPRRWLALRRSRRCGPRCCGSGRADSSPGRARASSWPISRVTAAQSVERRRSSTGIADCAAAAGFPGASGRRRAAECRPRP